MQYLRHRLLNLLLNNIIETMVETGTIAIAELSSTNYVPTELAGVIDHFLCKLCGYVVHKPKECP
jgi:hypothetical protein